MWVLLETVKTEECGKPIFFKGWASTAPEITDDVREAHQFRDREETIMSAAYRHRLSSFVPQEIELAVKSNAAA